MSGVADAGVPTATASALRPFVPRLAAAWHRERSDELARVLDASLLGLDISGFTALSERLAERGKLGAEELITLISGCYGGLIEIGRRYGGDVLKFRGDALLLLFDGDRHEERAARAALAMQAFVTESGSGESSVGPVRLGMAAGLVSGPCHFFLVGRHHSELIVCGPSASATLELEDAAGPGEVLVSARAAAALEGLVATERDGAFLLRRDAVDAELPPLPDEPGPESDDDLDALLPPTLRGPIATGAIEAEHRQATAAFVKFTGTDRLVETPDAAVTALAELADAVSSVTADLGITWLESDIDRDGGKLYLVAGAPASAGDDEGRMLRALRAIVDAGAGPPIAVGVNRGPVLAGPIGSPSRTTYAVMGDTVNLAARLAARAEKGEILATGDVLQRARTRFETTSRQFLMKGKAKPVTGHTVGALAGDAVEKARPLLPLVGRELELALLLEAVGAVRMRQSRAVEIVGEPGAGKSRLVEELAESTVGFQVLRARCEPYSSSTPFGPLRALLRPLIGVLPEESRESAGAKLLAFVQTVMPDLAQWLPLLALPFDAEVPGTSEVDDIDPVFRRDRLHDALDQMLGRMLLMPTVLLVEDVHWLDDASQLVLAKLAQPGPRPWLVVVTRRPSGLPLDAAGVVVLKLQPLGADEARALALAAAGDVALSEDQLVAVTERAAGNPLFIRELALAPGDEDALPETVESLLTIRIDTLAPNDRLLLRHASVIGPTFDLDLLAEILPEEATDPEQWIRLADFVDWAGPALLRFRHDLVRTAAYDGLSYARRREIHARVGDALERRAAGGQAVADVLSLHFLEAGRYEEAWAYAVAAGDDARSKYANIDAATFYERAVAAAEHFEPPGDDIARVCEALGDVRELAARYDDADAAYRQALDHGASRARVLRKRGVISERHGRYDEALELYEQAAADADAAEAVALELARAIILYRQGKIDECATFAARAAEGATALDDRASLADAYYVRAAAEGDRGGPAREFLDRALTIFQELGLLHRQATVLNNMGVRAYYEGAWDDALELYLRSEETVRRAGDVLTGGHATNNRAEILLDQGRLAEAAELFDVALRTYRAAKFPVGEALVMINLGRLSAEEGRFADAHRYLDDAQAQLEALGAESFLIEADARRAQALILEGRHDAVVELATTALERMRSSGELGVRSALLERLLGLAAVQARTPQDAAPHFEESLRLARSLRADYELGRTLHAKTLTGFASEAEAGEAEAILERLGVVALPAVPLP